MARSTKIPSSSAPSLDQGQRRGHDGVIGYNTAPISFSVSSVQALNGIRIQAGEQSYPVMENGTVSESAAATASATFRKARRTEP